MPIRPENLHHYRGQAWKAVRAQILERAGNRCEEARHPDCRAQNGQAHPETGSKVVLTIAHLDHNPANNAPENLRAWCQRCHNKFDAPIDWPEFGPGGRPPMSSIPGSPGLPRPTSEPRMRLPPDQNPSTKKAGAAAASPGSDGKTVFYFRWLLRSLHLEGKQVENFHYARTIGGWIRFLHHVMRA